MTEVDDDVVVVGVAHEHPVGVQLQSLPPVHAGVQSVDTHAFVSELYIFHSGHVQVLLLYVHHAALHSSIGTALHWVFVLFISLHWPTFVSHVCVNRLHPGLQKINPNEKFVLTKIINNRILIIFFID